jgi:hypothetical protein
MYAFLSVVVVVVVEMKEPATPLGHGWRCGWVGAVFRFQ